MQELTDKVQELVAFELNRANTIHPPKFNSMHEAYAVIMEEMEEAENEIDGVKRLMDAMWKHIKIDYGEAIISLLPSIETYAIHAAAEMIQVAAMCRKARL